MPLEYQDTFFNKQKSIEAETVARAFSLRSVPQSNSINMKPIYGHNNIQEKEAASPKKQLQELHMAKYNYETQTQKYEFISKQHGGYYRHDFIDHAYLYNLYFPPEAILNSLKNQIRDIVLNYPVAQDALAGLIGKLIHQPAERIVVGNGAAELIKIISGHISSKLIVPVPSFNEYSNAAPTGLAVEYTLEFPSFHLDVDKFAAEAIRIEADVIVVVTPNNPTSILVPKSDLISLAQKLADYDCMLIIDESFMDFVRNPDQTTLEHEIERYPNMAILKSMSKAYGICGLRIGYMVTANSAFAEAVRKDVHIWNINGFAEEFLRLLPGYRQEFAESCKQVRIDRDNLYKRLCAVQGMTVYKPDANFVFCRLPDYAPSAPEVTRMLFVEHNIYIKNCQGKSLTDSDRYIRIASRTETENCKLVEALTKIID
jgi:histidinol-phosphate/aromatic aminotransferase/cobyric acid decarboxylase-like protein